MFDPPDRLMAYLEKGFKLELREGRLFLSPSGAFPWIVDEVRENRRAFAFHLAGLSESERESLGGTADADLPATLRVRQVFEGTVLAAAGGPA